MNPAAFRALIHTLHRDWLAELLGFDVGLVSEHEGIDLLDSEVGVEIKCRNGGRSPHFTIHHHQREGYPGAYADRELFWAFVRYELDAPVKELGAEDCTNLDARVIGRAAWFLPWKFAAGFRASHTPRESYVYVPMRSLPPPERMMLFDVTAWSPTTSAPSRVYVPRDSPFVERLTHHEPPF